MRWSPSERMLAVASWDPRAGVTVLDCAGDAAPVAAAAFEFQAPVLACAFQDASTVLAGTAGASVARCDLGGGTGAPAAVGQHDGPVAGVAGVPSTGLVCSGSWDGTLAVWDPRLPEASRRVGGARLPGRCLSLAVGAEWAVAAGADDHLHLFRTADLAAGTARPVESRRSRMKCQTREVRCSPDGTGFAVGSVDGKVTVEDFGGHAKPFTFKCHRDKHPDGGATVWPVNALAFHPSLGTFATGGCDGTVAVWDPRAQKRLASYPALPSSVASLDVSADGARLAVASSYTGEAGERPPRGARDEVYLASLDGSEFAPRAR